MKRSFLTVQTQEKADAVQRLYLTANGEATEDYIEVTSLLSARARRIQEQLRDRVLSFVETHGEKAKDLPEYRTILAEFTDQLTRGLVVGWSFAEECNDANLIQFFTANPSFVNVVSVAAGKLSQGVPTLLGA